MKEVCTPAVFCPLAEDADLVFAWTFVPTRFISFLLLKCDLWFWIFSPRTFSDCLAFSLYQSFPNKPLTGLSGFSEEDSAFRQEYQQFGLLHYRFTWRSPGIFNRHLMREI